MNIGGDTVQLKNDINASRADRMSLLSRLKDDVQQIKDETGLLKLQVGQFMEGLREQHRERASLVKSARSRNLRRLTGGVERFRRRTQRFLSAIATGNARRAEELHKRLGETGEQRRENSRVAGMVRRGFLEALRYEVDGIRASVREELAVARHAWTSEPTAQGETVPTKSPEQNDFPETTEQTKRPHRKTGKPHRDQA